MEATHAGATAVSPPQTHPLLLLAAASVTMVSLAGVGVLSGWLPGPGALHAAPTPLISVPGTPSNAASQNIVVTKKTARPVAESPEPVPITPRREAPAPAAVNQSIAQAPVATPVPSPAAVNQSVAQVPVATPVPSPAAVSPAPTYNPAPPDATYRVATPQPPICNECGVVETVREVKVEAKGSGGGAIAGGLAGGLIGNQVGKNSGRSIATVLGAVGGAFAGNYIEKMLREGKRYEAVVRFEDGSTRTFTSETPPTWRTGDRVRLQNGLLTMGSGKSTGNPEII